MNKRRLIGLLTVTASIALLVLYTYLLFFASPEMQSFIMKITVFATVIMFLSVFIAIGLGLIKTPSIPPIREVEDTEEKCHLSNSEKG